MEFPRNKCKEQEDTFLPKSSFVNPSPLLKDTTEDLELNVANTCPNGTTESNSSKSLNKNSQNNLSPTDVEVSFLPSDRTPKEQESGLTILSQVCIPFIIAGLGMVAAGLILDRVKEWKVFKEVPEFIMLVTPLLGLKGNLEMTLASRLSTHANLGHMDTSENMWQICFGNLSLTQVQAIVVGLLASVVAIVTDLLFIGSPFAFRNALLLCGSSILTAAIASCILGVLMISVILLSKKFSLNPDNIATPIAASLGDIITLGLLATLASILHEEKEKYIWLTPAIICGFLLLTPLWSWITYKNEFTREVLITGWLPVVCAMLISSGSGFILDKASDRFPNLAMYQPVINGVGGDLVSIQSSRISTSLHKDCSYGSLPKVEPRKTTGSVCITPWAVFTKTNVNSVASRVLLGMVIPGHLIFSTITHFVGNGQEYSFLFMAFYLTAAVIQVAFLLYIAQVLINWLWKHKVDPDTSTIPYLTAISDLIGTGLLFVAFLLVDFFKH